MAGAYVRDHNVFSIKTLGTANTNLTTGVTPTIGNVLVAYILFDNFSTASKPIVSSIAKHAGETNNWVFLGAARSTSTSIGAFSSGEVWAIKTSVAWTAPFSYLVTLDSSVTMKATLMQEFSGLEAALRCTVGTAYSTTTTAAVATTSGTTPLVDDVAVGFAFSSNTTGTGLDVDTTGGAWGAGSVVASTGGSGTTNNAGMAQFKVLTSGVHQSFNVSSLATAGNGSICAILQATPSAPPTTTPATPTVTLPTAEGWRVTAEATFPSDATGYRVFEDGASMGVIATPSGTLDGSTKSAALTVTITAKWNNAGGDGAVSTSVNTTPNPGPPAFALTPGAGQADVAITRRFYAAKYKVYRRVTSVGGAYSVVHTSVTQVANGTYTYTDPGLSAVSYDYVVTTEAQTPTIRESAQSTLQAVTPSAPAAPARPQTVMVNPPIAVIRSARR